MGFQFTHITERGPKAFPLHSDAMKNDNAGRYFPEDAG